VSLSHSFPLPFALFRRLNRWLDGCQRRKSSHKFDIFPRLLLTSADLSIVGKRLSTLQKYFYYGPFVSCLTYVSQPTLLHLSKFHVIPVLFTVNRTLVRQTFPSANIAITISDRKQRIIMYSGPQKS